MHEVKVQIQFKADTKYGSYGDALYFTEDEWATLTEVKLESMKQDRIDNWVAYMATVTAPKTLTKFDYQNMITSIDSQIASLQDRKSDINSIIQGM